MKPGRNTPQAKSAKTRTKVLVWVALAAVFLLVFGLSVDARLKVVSYDVPSAKLDEPVRIVFVADLHACLYGTAQQELIDAVAAQKPDLVLLGGDLADDQLPRETARVFLAAVGQTYPCYFVTGNHEIWSDETDEILAMVRGCGIRILRGESELVEVGSQTLRVCGVDDPYAAITDGFPLTIEEQLALVGGEIGSGEAGGEAVPFTLLLTHRPELVDLYGQYDFDLVLAGHAHGGQVRIPGLMNGLLAPNQGLFPKYAGGAYFFGAPGDPDRWVMIVSRGLARESTPAPRIFNRPELVVVNLTPAK